MAIPYELIVAEDFNIGHGAVTVTMPGGGTASGTKVGSHTWLSTVFNVKNFGAVGDGVTDDTVAIEAAKAAAVAAGGGILFFPDGIYGINYTNSNPTFGLYINSGLQLLGVGADQTIIKNLSATAAGIRTASFSPVLRDFTLDQNGSTGVGLQIGGQYSVTDNVEVKNQGGTNYAIVIDGATLAELRQVRIHTSTYGMSLGPSPTGYVSLRQVSIETSTGIAFNASLCSRLDAYELHLEPSAGVSHGKIMHINNCQHVDFYGFSGEWAATLTDPAYVEIEDSRSVNFWGGRINHTGTASKTVFRVKGTSSQNVNWDGMDLISTKTGMVLFEVNAAGTLSNINQRRIRATLTATAVGVKHTTNVLSASVEDWVDNSAASTFEFSANPFYGRNIAGAITSTWVSPGDILFVNCPGAITGTGATRSLRLNSSAGSSVRFSINIAEFPTYANDAAAVAGGLVAGEVYKTSTGELRITL